ncbi:helix-turn-helix domain-containing protein [Alcaligenes faecalis]|uniref:helix-turn-helix domain-containing protein n=1 Tax=Alcaligenes faecalis TaxID=511 RepID=UPI002932867E|nr:helix-turn-helix domain-containing protein [Alcaligenes faecalis]MDV2116473.1 helix-turn-helix domain-containing protein [Alcaligenes faecalis]
MKNARPHEQTETSTKDQGHSITVTTGKTEPRNDSRLMAQHNTIESRSTTTQAQRARLIALLRTAPRHTHELRANGISHPAGRVQDLLKMGFEIKSSRTVTVDSDGFAHYSVAMYVLISEPNFSKAGVDHE